MAPNFWFSDTLGTTTRKGDKLTGSTTLRVRLGETTMSQHLRAPTSMMRRPLKLGTMALPILGLVFVGCATIAGFEDFSAKGTGGTGTKGTGGSSSALGGESGTGGESGGSGGVSETGGGSAIICGAVTQRCCAASPSCATGSCCYNGTCIAVGYSCGSSNTCQSSGHCSNCGQSGQNCCGGTSCEFGNECSNTTCRGCGSNGLSCCDSPGFPACTGSVCVSSTGPLQNLCAANCGAANQACCTGSATGCEVGTNLTCSNGKCVAP